MEGLNAKREASHSDLRIFFKSTRFIFSQFLDRSDEPERKRMRPNVVDLLADDVDDSEPFLLMSPSDDLSVIEEDVTTTENFQTISLGLNPVPLMCHSCVRTNVDTFMVAGGEDYNDEKSISTVFEYSINDHKWSRLPDMIQGRKHFSLLSENNKVYAIGGMSNNESNENFANNTVEVYDKNKWTLVTSNIITPRYGTMVVSEGGSLYMFGGYINNTVFDGVEKFDLQTEVWSKMTYNNDIDKTVGEFSGVHGCEHVVSIGEIKYFFGGARNFGLCYKMSSKFDDPEMQIEPIESMRISCSWKSIVVHNKKVYLFGGEFDASNVLCSVQIYDTSTNEWSDGPRLPYRSSALGAVSNDDGFAYITGGYEASDKFYRYVVD